MRIGFGYDSHRFDPSRPLKLGGVLIEGSPGLAGHSDADVLLHAVIDAILGAAALGDIGSHFPDTCERWRGADSAKLLAAVVGEAAAAGFRVGNIDATVICERPKLRPHVGRIRDSIASLLHVDASRVSVKGKTNEGMDATGAGIGIAVHCAALLEEPPARDNPPAG